MTGATARAPLRSLQSAAKTEPPRQSNTRSLSTLALAGSTDNSRNTDTHTYVSGPRYNFGVLNSYGKKNTSDSAASMKLATLQSDVSKALARSFETETKVDIATNNDSNSHIASKVDVDSRKLLCESASSAFNNFWKQLDAESRVGVDNTLSKPPGLNEPSCAPVVDSESHLDSPCGDVVSCDVAVDSPCGGVVSCNVDVGTIALTRLFGSMDLSIDMDESSIDIISSAGSMGEEVCVASENRSRHEGSGDRASEAGSIACHDVASIDEVVEICCEEFVGTRMGL